MARRIFLFVCLLLLPLFAGCGGGSSGTDGGVSIRIVGTVKNSEGKPLPGVSITIKENGDQASTDENGKYDVPTTVTPGEIAIIIAKDSREAEVSVDAQNARPSQTIAVDLTLDEVAFSATIASVTIITDPQPTPSPQATIVANQSYEISGVIKTTSGSAVKGFTVKVTGSGNVDSTDKKGAFSLSTSDRTPELVISNKKHRVVLSLGAIPRSATLVKLSLVITINSGSGVQAQAENAPFKVKVKTKVSY